MAKYGGEKDISYGLIIVPKDTAACWLKLLLGALGIDTSGEVEVSPEILQGRRCTVDVVIDAYVKSDGTEGKANQVPFAGYHAIEEGDEAYVPY